MRRWLIVVPLAIVAAAAAGSTWPHRLLLVAFVAAVLSIAVVVLAIWLTERRVAMVAAFLEDLTGTGRPEPLDERGGPQWRRLTHALNHVGASLEQRVGQVQAERARAERLLDDVPAAILLFEGDDLAYANRQAAELFGDPPAERRTALQLLGSPGLAGAVAETRESGRPVEVEVRLGGRTLGGRAVQTGDRHVALVVTDLTHARRVEQMRRDFVTNASHELKTPVAGIQALADSLSLALDRDPSRAERMVKMVQLEAARLGSLVRELLDLARLEETASPEGRRRVDLAEVVRREAQRLSGVAADRGVRILPDGDASVPLVAYPEDVRLIVANLVENGVVYNREGGEVVVRTLRQDGDAVLDVADTGIGIPAAALDRIFERFYRVDKARSRAAGGTGLGLSIVRHAVARHGGDIRVRSVLGEGSAFTVVLPVEGPPED